MFFLLISFIFVLFSQNNAQLYQARFDITPYSALYTKSDSNDLIATFTNISKLITCLQQCNENINCRTVDYSPTQNYRCRLFQGIWTMGVVSTTNSTPPDNVASVILEPPLYISHNLSCNMSGSASSLMYDRYLLCNAITNMFTCPPMTYWNGNICMNQGYTGSPCTSVMPMCRLDLSLSCASRKCGKSKRRHQIGMQRTRAFGFEFDYSDHFMKNRPKYYAKNDLRTNQSESFMKSIIRKSDVLRPALKLKLEVCDMSNIIFTERQTFKIL